MKHKRLLIPLITGVTLLTILLVSTYFLPSFVFSTYLTITFVNVSAEATGTGAVTPALPASMQSGDICILVATTLVAGTVTISATGSIPTWNVISGSPVDVALGEKLYVWWGLWTSGTTGPTVTPGGDHIEAGIGAWRNCVTSPIDVTQTGTETTSDTSFSFATSISTTVDGGMCICVCTTGEDIATNGRFTTMTDSSLTSLAERMDYETSSGGGGGFALAQGFKASAGAVGTWASTLTTASAKAYISFALKPKNVYTSALSQSISTLENVGIQSSFHSPLTKTLTTSNLVGIQSGFHISLSKDFATSENVGIQTNYKPNLSQPLTTSQIIGVQTNYHSSPSQSLETTKNVGIQTNFHVGTSNSMSTLNNIDIQSNFHSLLSNDFAVQSEMGIISHGIVDLAQSFQILIEATDSFGHQPTVILPPNESPLSLPIIALLGVVEVTYVALLLSILASATIFILKTDTDEKLKKVLAVFLIILIGLALTSTIANLIQSLIS